MTRSLSLSSALCARYGKGYPAIRKLPNIFIALVIVTAGCGTEPDTSTILDEVVIDGPLTEVDLVTLGGGSSGAAPSLAVSVGATGTGGRLTSWSVTAQAVAPAPLVDSAILPGSNHQLHVLTPALSPTLSRGMLISASIAGGTLVVRSWRVGDDGSFAPLDIASYRPAGGSVADYTLGHRQITAPTRTFQLVAPVVRVGGASLRMVTWAVDGTTGKFTAPTDTGDLVGGLAADPQLAVSFVSGTPTLPAHYAVSCLNAGGQIINTSWKVDDLGASTLTGNYTSGKDIANSGAVVRSALSLASAPLTASGFVTVGNLQPSMPTPATGEVQVWEALACSPPGGCIVPLNLSDSSRDIAPAVLGVQQAAVPGVTAPRAVAVDPAYDLELYAKSPTTKQSIASVRKAMVLIVALEAVADGEASLDEILTVSAAAAGTGGSSMGLVTGERITLRDLLYGMMMVSAGDATWAISERVAGSVEGMVKRMNDKAFDLGLADTVYCHDADDRKFSSVGYSTARDQALLWASAYNDPLFLEIAGKASATVCGTLPDTTMLCHPTPPPMTKNMTQYLELDGWKNGNGGSSCAAYAALSKCTDCLTAQATRLGRSMVSSSLRTVGSGAAWSDATTMFDYAYRQVFTPDFRGDSAGQGGAASDFGLATVSETFAMTAVPTGAATIRVCNWGVNAGTGTLAKMVCTNRAVVGLMSGGPATVPRRVGLVRLSTLEAEADYLLGRITAGSLKLSAWRVGQKN